MARRQIATFLGGIALVAAGCAPGASSTTSLHAVASPSSFASTSVIATSSASPAISPTPTPVGTMAPPPPELATVRPVAGTVLPIAARDGAPGLVACGRLRLTTLEALSAVPTGAEERQGEEYDVLRATIEQYGDDSEFMFRGQTFREFRLDATTVEFLGSKGLPEGPFSSISVAAPAGRWKRAGIDGGCVLTGQRGPEWGWVNWTLDGAYAPPTAKTRTLHLLTTDYECVGRAPLRGRLAPAWVFLEPGRVRIQLFSQLVHDAKCGDQKPTKVTVRLPEPLGTRELVDANPEPCRGCGG